MSARYSVVLFDVGETLIGPRDSYAAVYAGVLRELGLDLPVEALERGIRVAAAEVARSVPTGADRFSQFPGGESAFWARLLTRVLELVGCEADSTLVRRTLDRLSLAFGRKAAWRIYDDVVPVLDELTAGGFRLAVVSNWDSRLPRLLETLGLAKYFETIGVSHLERIEKPDPAFFVRVLERIGATPDRALHVGNTPEQDLAGARAAGVDCVLVARHGAREGMLGDLRPLPGIARDGISRWCPTA